MKTKNYFRFIGHTVICILFDFYANFFYICFVFFFFVCTLYVSNKLRDLYVQKLHKCIFVYFYIGGMVDEQYGANTCILSAINFVLL